MSRRAVFCCCIITAAAVVAPPVLRADTAGTRTAPSVPGQDETERAGAGCPPLPGGTDTFPSTAKLVIDDAGVGQPFVVRLSSAGLADAVVQRTPQVGDTIATELVQLELAGFHPRVGAITLRQSPTQPSLGQIRNVEVDGSCELANGLASFDLFVEIEVGGVLETWDHQQPIRVEAPIAALPLRDVRYEVPSVEPIALRDMNSAQERGQVLYALHHADPAFPPQGADCHDTLLTADLHLFGPGSTANLIGFGPSRVLRDDATPGGVCSIDGNPCDSDVDCPFQTCLHPRVETEIVELGAAGFDPLLGDWQVSVLPDRGTSDCCAIHAEPGCSDPVCEALICGLDSFCCTDTWDDLCAGLAANEPTCAENCLDPDANPTLGAVRSAQIDRTYPATSSFNLFVVIDTAAQGSLHHDVPIPLEPPGLINNLPPDPNTEYRYDATPIPLFDPNDSLAGEISNVVHTLQPPADCEPPPPASEDCLESVLRLDLSLPPCPPESVALPGVFRMLRDDPADGSGLGQEIIDTVLAKGEFDAVSACSGTLGVRLSSAPATTGAVASLAPEEFFPADSVFDVTVEIDAVSGTLTSDPFSVSTSVNAVPVEAGEIYVGPATVIDLRDGTGAKLGEILEIAHEVQSPAACPPRFNAAIRFAGPTKNDLAVGIPGGGGGADYDVARGDLGALHASDGSFASAACLVTDEGPAVSDGATPTAGDGFYYVARDGLGAFNGTWNGSGTAQQADRDTLLPSCE
jgi:hypothetical protein